MCSDTSFVASEEPFLVNVKKSIFGVKGREISCSCARTGREKAEWRVVVQREGQVYALMVCVVVPGQWVMNCCGHISQRQPCKQELSAAGSLSTSILPCLRYWRGVTQDDYVRRRMVAIASFPAWQLSAWSSVLQGPTAGWTGDAPRGALSAVSGGMHSQFSSRGITFFFRAWGWRVHKQVLELDPHSSSCRALPYSTETRSLSSHTEHNPCWWSSGPAWLLPTVQLWHICKHYNGPSKYVLAWRAVDTGADSGSMLRWHWPVQVISPSTHGWIVKASRLHQLFYQPPQRYHQPGLFCRWGM